MNKITDHKLIWQDWKNCESLCRVQIFERANDCDFIIILTEPQDNPGVSVTNGCDQIVDTICRQRNIDPVDVIFIEHYEQPDDTWDEITFTIDDDLLVRSPVWQRRSWAWVAELIGAPAGSEWRDV